MKKIMMLLLCLLLSVNVSASLLAPEGRGAKVETVTLATHGTTTLEGENLKLTSLGAGLRSKKVVFVNIKVYVGQLFLASPDTFKKSEPMSSLKDQKAIAIQLHFLRDVDGDSVQKSFKEALKANKVDIENPLIKQFLDAVNNGGEAKQGQTLTVLGTHHKDGSEMISYEKTGGRIAEIKGSIGFIEQIFSIWLGIPADEGVANLKKDLLKN